MQVLNREKPTAFLNHDILSDLVERFSECFVGKIKTIRKNVSEFEATTELLSCPPIDTILPSATSSMDSFEPTTQTEILKIINSSSKASSKLDPLLLVFWLTTFFQNLCPL